MTDIAIRVDNLSKLYPEPAARAGHLGAVHQRPDTLRDALTAPFRRKHDRTTERAHDRTAPPLAHHRAHQRHSTCIDYRFAVCLVIIGSGARMAQENQ